MSRGTRHEPPKTPQSRRSYALDITPSPLRTSHGFQYHCKHGRAASHVYCILFFRFNQQVVHELPWTWWGPRLTCIWGSRKAKKGGELVCAAVLRLATIINGGYYSICPSPRTGSCLSISLCAVCISVCLPTCLFICLCTYILMNVCLYISPSQCIILMASWLWNLSVCLRLFIHFLSFLYSVRVCTTADLLLLLVFFLCVVDGNILTYVFFFIRREGR